MSLIFKFIANLFLFALPIAIILGSFAIFGPILTILGIMVVLLN